MGNFLSSQIAVKGMFLNMRSPRILQSDAVVKFLAENRGQIFFTCVRFLRNRKLPIGARPTSQVARKVGLGLENDGCKKKDANYDCADFYFAPEHRKLSRHSVCDLQRQRFASRRGLNVFLDRCVWLSPKKVEAI